MSKKYKMTFQRGLKPVKIRNPDSFRNRAQNYKKKREHQNVQYPPTFSENGTQRHPLLPSFNISAYAVSKRFFSNFALPSFCELRIVLYLTSAFMGRDKEPNRSANDEYEHA